MDRDLYEVFPNIIPDLYSGETATILIKCKSLPASINVTGDYGNSEWQTSSQLTSTSRNGISVSWASEKIDSLMNLHHQSNTESERNSIEKEITDTALKHHLVSRYTSLVAVDKTPVNIDEMLHNQRLHSQRLKNNLPHGWTKSAATNGIMLAQTATNSRFNLLMAVLLFFAAFMVYRCVYRGNGEI